jgi:hypothetical protein
MAGGRGGHGQACYLPTCRCVSFVGSIGTPVALPWPGWGCFVAMIIERFLGASHMPGPLLQGPPPYPWRHQHACLRGWRLHLRCTFPIQFLVATAHLDPADSRNTLVVVDKCVPPQRFCTHYCTNVPWLFARAAAWHQHYARSTRFRGVWGGRDDDAALADTLGFMFLFATVRVLQRRAH